MSEDKTIANFDLCSENAVTATSKTVFQGSSAMAASSGLNLLVAALDGLAEPNFSIRSASLSPTSSTYSDVTAPNYCSGTRSDSGSRADDGGDKANKDYWEKRRRNNEAARRSREKRRQNDIAMEARLVELSFENKRLREELASQTNNGSLHANHTEENNSNEEKQTTGDNKILMNQLIDQRPPLVQATATVKEEPAETDSIAEQLPLISNASANHNLSFNDSKQSQATAASISPRQPKPIHCTVTSKPYPGSGPMDSTTANSAMILNNQLSPPKLPESSETVDDPRLSFHGFHQQQQNNAHPRLHQQFPPEAVSSFAGVGSFLVPNHLALAANCEALLALSLLQAAALPLPSLLQQLQQPAINVLPDSNNIATATALRLLKPELPLKQQSPDTTTGPDISSSHRPELIQLQNSAFSALASALPGKQYLRQRLLEKQNRLAEAAAATSNVSRQSFSVLEPELPLTAVGHHQESWNNSSSPPNKNTSVKSEADSSICELAAAPAHRKPATQKRTRQKQPKKDAASSGPKRRRKLPFSHCSRGRAETGTELTNLIGGADEEKGNSNNNSLKATLFCLENSTALLLNNTAVSSPLSNSSSSFGCQSPTLSSGDDHFYPCRDSKYVERRRRNNEAAKRCRANRRATFDLRNRRSQELEQENTKLKEEMLKLSKELELLKQLVTEKCSNVQQSPSIVAVSASESSATDDERQTPDIS